MKLLARPNKVRLNLEHYSQLATMKMRGLPLATVILALCSGVLSQPPPPLPPPLRMANVFGDHMVLQQAPAQAIVWGFVSKCDSKLSATFNEQTMTPTQAMDSTGMCVWKLMLPATAADATTTYKITITSDKYGTTGISDVMFGDVWICSGQSNMQFAVSQAFGGKDEIAGAGEYPLIRLFTADLKYSETPQHELISVEQPWSVASPQSVGGGDWKYFSATCWFFGKNIFKTLKYPIGLVATNWGGTRVEAWSSPDALSKCPPTGKGRSSHPMDPQINQNSPSALWNAMIFPFLNMTIKGATWYQGEANAGNADAYNCSFPAMIDDWREKWFAGTNSQTTPLYFGFVQLAPTGNSNVTVGGFPQVRWSQTAGYGYVPNPRMKDVFMAVAIDLGDPTSPYGSIHPRDKSDVGLRLSIGARAVVYNDATVNYLGMLPQKATMKTSTDSNITAIAITYSPPKSAEDKLMLKYPYGFEVGCEDASGKMDSQWVEGTAKSVTETDVNVEFPACGSGLKPMSVRYCWRTDPCTFNMCPVYSSSMNPSPPFVMDLQ